MRRIVSISYVLVLASLFAVALWFRVTSLESMPFPDGDEAWYAVQVAHLLKGRPFEAFTPTGNPLNPFFAGMHVPTLLTMKPALWLLRVPAVVCGVLAVVLTYVLGRKIFDRTTALIASALLAMLPIAIIYSRIGFDPCQTPLISLLAIYFAFRANLLGLILSFVASHIIHPTNVFLLPVVLAVFLVQEFKKTPGDRKKQLRMALMTLTVTVVLVVAVGLITLCRNGPALEWLYQPGPKPILGKHDVLRFVTNCRKLFEAVSGEAPPATTRWNDAIFWVPFLVIVGLGTWQFVREKQWERVALVFGLFASAAGFFVVAGSDILCPLGITIFRYGMFLVTPTVLVFACSARSLLVEPTTAGCGGAPATPACGAPGDRRGFPRLRQAELVRPLHQGRHRVSLDLPDRQQGPVRSGDVHDPPRPETDEGRPGPEGDHHRRPLGPLADGIPRPVAEALSSDPVPHTARARSGASPGGTVTGAQERLVHRLQRWIAARSRRLGRVLAGEALALGDQERGPVGDGHLPAQAGGGDGPQQVEGVRD